MGIIITPPPSLLGREPKPPEQKPLLTTPPSDLDIRFVLDPLNLPQETKAKAWDDFYGSSDPEDFQKKFDAIALPQEAKADLWDLRFVQGAKQTIDKRELEKMRATSKQKLTDIAPFANEPTQSEFSAQLMEKAGGARALMLQEHQRRLQAGEYDETKRYRMARDLHEQVQNMDDSVTTALKEGITEVPFLRYLEKTDLLIQVKGIADKVENKEPLTPGERALGEAYVTNLEAAGRYNPSFVTRVMQTVGAQPAFWAEFAAMGGLAAFGQKAAVAGLEKVGATQLAKLGTEELTRESLKGLGVKGTAKALLGRGLVVTTGELARAVGIPMYAPETVQRMAGGPNEPGMGLRLTDIPEMPGEKELTRSLDQDSKEGFFKALGKAFGGTAVETISEQAGGSYELAQSWLKSRVLGKWLKRKGVEAVTSAAEKLAHKIGWNGVVGEVFEEEIANPFHAWLDGKGFTEGLRSLDPTDPENQKRVAEEFVAFGLTGVMGHKLAKPYNQIAQYIQQEMQARDENPGVEPPKVTPEERAQYAMRGRIVPGEGAEPVVEEPTAQQMGLREARHRMKIRVAEAETARQEELPPISRRFQEAYEAQTAKSAAERYQAELDKKESDRRAEQERQSELARKQLQPKRPYEEPPKVVQVTPEPEPDPAIVRVVEPNIDEWLSRPQTAQEEFEAEVDQARKEIQERRAQRALAIVRVMMEEERQRGDELKRLADAAEKEEEQIRKERGLASIVDLRRVRPDLDSTEKRGQADASVQRMDELKRLAEDAEKEEERLRAEYGFRYVGRRQAEEPPTVVAPPPVGGAAELPTTPKRTEGQEQAAPPIKPEIASKGRREIAEAPPATAAERLQTLRTELNNMRRRRRNAGPASDQAQVQQLDQMIADYERLALEHEKIVAATSDLPLYRQIVGETALRADKGAETRGTAADLVRAEQEAEGAQIPVPEGILRGLEAFPAHTVRWVTDKAETARSYTNTEEPLQLSPDAVVIASMGDGSHLVFDPGAPAPPAAPAVATAETEAKRIVEAAGHAFVTIQSNYGAAPDNVIFRVQGTDTTVGLPVDGLTVEKVKARADRTLEDLGIKQAAEVKPLPAAEPGTFSEITDRSGANVPVAWGTSTVSDTTRGTEVNLQYAVVPASALGTSFNPKTFEPDPDYPQTLQPRDRSRFASRDQFNQLTTAGAGQMNFERMADSRNAADGAPVVGDDLNVETRNMGTTALKWLYTEGSPIAGEYRKTLLQNLDRFGLGAVKDSVDGMQDPVLVRIRRTPMNMNQRAKFAAEANEPAQAAMSAVEQAKKDAQLMTGRLMAALVPTDNGELHTRANEDFQRAFFSKVVSPADAGRYMRPDGSVSTDGLIRMRNAVFARAYPGAEEMLAALAEDPTGNVRNIVNGMVMAAPKFAVLHDAIERGLIHNLDISADIGQAGQKLSALRSAGESVEDYLNQQRIFGQELSPSALEILRAFNEYARSAKSIRDLIGGYADAALRVGSTQQMGLLGPAEPPAKESILRGVMTRVGGPSLVEPQAAPTQVSPPPGEVGPVRVEPPPVSAVTEPPVAIAAQAEPATTVVEPPPVGIPTRKVRLSPGDTEASLRDDRATHEDFVRILKGALSAGEVTEEMAEAYEGTEDALEVGTKITPEMAKDIQDGIESEQQEIADVDAKLQLLEAMPAKPRKGKAAPKTGEATEPPVQPGIEAKKGFWRLYTFVPDAGIRHVEDFPEKWTKKHGEVQKQNVQDSDEPLLLIDDKGAVVAKSAKWGDTGGRAQALRISEPSPENPQQAATQDYSGDRYAPYEDTDSQREYYAAYGGAIDKETNVERLRAAAENNALPDGLRQAARDRLLTIVKIENAATKARALIDAALANETVQTYATEPDFAAFFSPEQMRQEPIVRAEFEHVTVFGDIAGSISYGKKHNEWGAFLGIEPVRSDDVFFPLTYSVEHKPTSPRRQRYEARKELRAALPKEARNLVKLAKRNTKEEFLTALDEQQAFLIQDSTGLTPEDFWTQAKGKKVQQRGLPIIQPPPVGPQALRKPAREEMRALPGMEEAVTEQVRQAGLFQREELEKRMAEGRPLEKGRPIEESPLFRGTEAAPQREMFASTSDAEVTKISVYAAMAKAAGGELVGIQKGMLGVGDKIAVQDQTGHMALVPIEKASVQEIREALQAVTSEPQALMTEKGTLAPGGDIERAWQVMSASLYKDRGPKVVVKELLQNAFDSLREVDASIDPERADRYQRMLAEGQKRKVTATVSRMANKIIVSDTGIGMTLSEFGNAFTNLFEAAKTGLVGRSGEFAVAKAAIFSIPDSLSVESVAYDPSLGRKMKVSFTSTPEEFFEGKVRPVTEDVSQSTPTGTKITATSKDVGWDAENFADKTLLSLQPPADVEVYLDENGLSEKPKAVSKPVSQLDQHLATVSFPGSSVEIWKSSTNGDHMFDIAVEVNNNGIFQFFQYIRIDDNSKVWGAPNRIAVNIKATVPAGHVEYPFTASREDLRGNLWSEIAKHIDALILAPLRMKTRDYIQSRYDNLPLIETKQGNAPFYDLGKRLTPGETKTVLQLGSMKDIASALQEVAHRMQAALMEQPLEEWGIKRYSWDKEKGPLGSGISRVGVFFSEPGYHGVHIPNLSAPPGSREATILINPFNFAQRGRGDESSYDLAKTSPNQAIDYTIGVMGHEILHDLFGHGAEMQYAEVQLARVIADIRPELEEILRRAYDPAATGRVRPDLAVALAIYQESRGRKERERDVLGGQALADRPEQPPRPDEVRPIGGVTPVRAGDVRLGAGGAGGERTVKPPVERWQWLRNAEGDQRAGNRTAIFELDEPLYNTFVKPRMRPGYAANLAEYQSKHPGVRYISLTQVAGEGPKTFDRVGTLEELRPQGEQLKWAKRVASFDSSEAKEWSALSDTEVYHAEAAERGERPHGPARVQETGRPGEVAGPKGTRGTPRSLSEAGERPGAGPRRTGGKRLEDVAPVKIDAQVVRQTPPVRDLEEWREALREARLPEVIPQPTQKLSPEVARKMKYQGQVEVAEAMLSEMVDGSGGFLLAVGTGGGKSYEASAVAAELKKRGLLNYGMVVVPNQILGKMWEDVMAHYGVMAQSLPSGVTAPPGKGVWIVTDASLAQRANIRKAGVRKVLEDGGLAEFPWDLAIVDEADRARKHQISDRGMVVKRLGEKSSRMIYATATPFHSAVDFGYLEKLGLWRYSGFDKWIRQFPGVHQDEYGYWEGGHNPWMLAKLRMQLLERGQMITQLADYSGFTVNFGVVPLSTQQQQTLADIKTAFTLALNYFKAARRFTQIKPTLGHAVMFAKDYLERARLPQLIEVAKKGEAQGFKVEFFSARRSEVADIYNFLKEADEGLDGRISALLPKLPDVVKTLKDAFGDDLANFSGPDSPERTQELKDFQSGKKKHIFATYDAGARGIGMHDTVGDAPRLLLLVGLPWSAFQFDQSFGRPWRFGTKSNVVAIVLTSNAKAEFQMVTAKVGPRLQSLDAAVRGVDQTTPAAKRFADLDGRLAYDLGMKTKADMDDLSTTVDDKGIIANYSDINIPDASNLKNKGINVKERVQGPPSIGSMRMGLVPDPELIAATITRLRDRMKAAMEGNSVMPPPGERTKEDDQVEYMLSGLNMAETIPDEEERGVFADSANSLAEEAAKGAEEPTPAFVSVWRGITKWISKKDKSPQGFAGGKGLLPFFITHGREIIRRRGGEIGMIIADDKIPKYHVIAENVSGRYSDRLMGIMEKYALSKDERANAFYVTEGRETPINQKVADAAREWRELDNEIGDQLEAEGIQVETIDRKTGRKTFVPFRKLADHMPHMYDKEVLDISSKRYKDAVKRTMKRYGIDRAAAEKRIQERADRGVRLAGNVERHRNRDIEGYDATVDAYLRYLQQVGEAIARKRVFGQFREKLSGLIATMPDAEDRKTVTHIMDQLLDVNPTSEEIKKAVQKVYGYTIMTKMFTSALPGMADFVRAGLYASNRAMLRSARDMITDYSGARKRAFRSGVLNQYIKQRILEEWGVDPQGKAFGVAAEKWLEAIGYVAVDRTGRIFTDGVARNFLTLEALPALMRSESMLTQAIKATPILRKLEVGHEHWRRILREHYQLTDEQIDGAIKRGFWTEEELDSAASALSDKVQYTHDPTEMPPAMRAISKDKPGQAASAALRMAMMLKTTLFKQTYTLKDGLVRELKKGNVRPWVPFLTWSPLLGEMVLDVLHLAMGDPERFLQLWESETWEPGNVLRRIADNITFGAGQTTISVLWGMISRGIDVIDWIAPAALNDFTTFLERVVAPGAQDLVDGNPEKIEDRFWKWAVTRFPGARFTKKAAEKAGLIEDEGEGASDSDVFVVEPPPVETVAPPPVPF